MRDVAVGAQHAELVDELGRAHPEARRAHRPEALELHHLPRLTVDAAAIALALERGLAQVQMRAQPALAHDVGDIEQGNRVERIRRMR